MPPRRGREDRGASLAPRGRAPSSILLDLAFHQAYKASAHGTDRLDRSRRRALLKIVRTSAVLRRQLRLRSARCSAALEEPLSAELLARRFGPSAVPGSLGRVYRAQTRLLGLSEAAQRSLRRRSDVIGIGAEVRAFYGRAASMIREVDANLVTLEAAERFLKQRPRIDPNVATVVVAGFPNVGKSSLVARLSSAKPEVAAYPFTTLSIAVGHADLGFDRMQVMDTPGVLGRAGRTNPAEGEALVALEHAADAILFVLDPTEECGYTLAEQEQLLARWKDEYGGVPILEVETKADLTSSPSSRLRVSAVTGAGLKELKALIQGLLRAAVLSKPAPIAPEELTTEFELGG
ncbi:MAG: 50S ribosome-binding GTPase [Thermoplasmata archaeon]|nr:50S ribosome-binding GTPase [Thermoplasmata archaeon]